MGSLLLRRRIILSISLGFLSPLIAEYLLGDVAIDAIALGLFLGPIYGGGAILVREAARHRGRGWLTLILLALAYGMVEEGLATQTLFNPHYFGLSLLRDGYIPILGMGAWWTVFVLTLHTVWSISVPIAIVEAFAPEPTAPWLGKVGLAVASVLFVLGGLVIFWGTRHQEQFVAAPGQLVGVGVAVVSLVIVAFSVREPRLSSDRTAPGPWIVGAFSLTAGSAHFLLRYALAGWPLVAAQLILVGWVAVSLVRWSSRKGWGPVHRVSLAGGALMTYAWHSFVQTPLLGSSGTIDLIGNVVFSMGAVLLLLAAIRAASRTGIKPKACSV